MKVRVFAGPNGSEKSTLIYSMENGMKLNMGFVINADDIEKQLNENKKYTFDEGLILETKQLIKFISTSTINKKHNLKNYTSVLSIQKNQILLSPNSLVNSYVCAAIADFLRTVCVTQQINFSFESVFSDFRKAQFVQKLKEAGYDIYFYFVCTINPSINIARVHNRVLHAGHNVSEEKIKSRFQKSITNAIKAKVYTKRFFLIDNSQENNPILLLETENNNKTNFINKTFYPAWAEPFKFNN